MLQLWIAEFPPLTLKFQGPIVRINPNEVHFNDPDFIDTIYPIGGRKIDKPASVGWRTGSRHRTCQKSQWEANSPLSPAQNSILATISHDVHRMRRNSINAFFSTASVRKVEPMVREKLEKMLSRWGEPSSKDAKVLHLHTVFRAYASDIITTYAFGDCFHFLAKEDWGKAYFEATENYFHLTHIFAHFPIAMKLFINAPKWALRLLILDMSEITEKQNVRAHTFTSLHALNVFFFVILSMCKRTPPLKVFCNSKKKNGCFSNGAEV